MQIPADQRLAYITEVLKEQNIRFPNAELERVTKFNKGNISRMLNGEIPISDNFFKTFLGVYPDPPKGFSITETPNGYQNKYIKILEEQLEDYKNRVFRILQRMEPNLAATLENTVYARAEVRGAIEYQVMKDAKNNEKMRAKLMEQINTLIQMNLPEGRGTGS